jgi:hypothetical protein
MPTSLGYAPRKSGQPAQQQAPAMQGDASMWPEQGQPFSNPQWAYLTSRNNSQAGRNSRVGSYFNYNGTNYSNQYNYLGGTLGAANYGNQAAGSEQLNRYGQPLGTLGPLNNRRTMTMQFFNGSGTNPDKVFLPPNIRFNTPGGGIPTSHGTGGIKPTKTNNGGGTNQYNDLINWRI